MTIEEQEDIEQADESLLLEGEIIEDENENDMAVDSDDEQGEPDQMDDAGEGQQDDEVLFKDDSVQGFFGHQENPVYSVDVHPKYKDLICSGGGDDLAHLWLRSDGSHLYTLSPSEAIPADSASDPTKFADSIVDVRFNSDGSLLACSCMDGTISFYAVNVSDDGLLEVKFIGAADGPDEVVTIKWHPNGPVLLAGSQDGNIWMYSVALQHQQPADRVKFMGVFAYHTEQISNLEWLHDGKSFISTSTDGSLCLWHPRQSDAPQWRLSGANNTQFHQGPIISMTVNANGLIATGDDQGSIRLTHSSNGKVVGQLKGGHAEDCSIESLLFNSSASGPVDDLSVLMSAGMDGKLAIWDMKSLSIRSTLSHSAGVNHVQLVPGRPEMIVTSTVDEENPVITMWNWKSGEKINEWRGHQAPILTMNSCGEYVVSGGDDGACLIFN